MMSPFIKAMLRREESEVHSSMLDFCSRRLKAARRYWSQRHPAWQEAERLIRAYRNPDKSDIRTESQSMTEGVRKIVVPESFAQVQSILAWMLSVFTERKPLIPVEGVGPEDQTAAILHEYMLEYQLDNMEPTGALVMFQWFHDALTYGVGAIKNHYTVREWPELIRVGDEIVERDVVSYEGNEAMNVSPFDFLPDPRRPMGEFQKGEFCAHEFRRSHTELVQKMAQGLYAGVSHIPKDSQPADKSEGYGNLKAESELARTLGMSDYPHDSFGTDDRPYYSMAEMYAYCYPRKMGWVDPREAAGAEQEELTPRMWVFTIANDARVIRAESANLPSWRFPFELIEMHYNIHSPVNPGIVEIIQDLNYHESWLFNSRMANVRKTLNNETLIDSSLVEEADLAESNASGFIRLNQHAQGGGVPLDQIAKPFPVVDVTASHHQDAAVVRQIIEQITGANRLIQGLSNTGRRAATEVQGQLSLASGRMRVFALIAAVQGLSKWGRQMVRNLQVFMETSLGVRLKPPYNQIIGQDAIVVVPQLLQGRFRFPFLETGMPNDRFFEANIWREILAMGMQNQLAAPALQQINFLEVFARLLMAVGVKNVQDFYQPGRFPMATAQAMQQMAAAQGGQVMPDEQVLRQQDQGNLVPSDGFALPQANATPGVGPNGLGGQNGVPQFI